jgi:hypothetical protein
MSIMIASLLFVIAAELGVLVYQNGGGGGLPWMVKADKGLLSGKVVSPMHHHTVAAKLEYLMCGLRYQMELEDQRFRVQQGLPPSNDLDLDAPKP